MNFGGFALLAYLYFFRGQGTITDNYYFDQTIPVTILALACLFHGHVDKLSQKQFVSVIITFLGLSFLVLKISTDYRVSSFSNVYGNIAIALFGLSFLLFDRINWKLIYIPIISVCFINLFSLVPVLSNCLFNYKYPNSTDSWKYRSFMLSVKWVEVFDKIDPMRKCYLWYSMKDRYGVLFRQLSAASHMWQGRLINEDFPAAKVPPNHWTGPTVITPQEGDEIMIMSTILREKYKLAEKSLEQLGLSMEIREVYNFSYKGARFKVIKGVITTKSSI